MNVTEFLLRQYCDFSPYFKEFNPVQSEAIQYVLSSNNLVLSSPTGSGKTEVAEMFIAEALSRGKKSLYLVPMKSIGEEKFYGRLSEERHAFNKLVKILVTGDYQMTEKRKQYMNFAQLIAATSEMLDHRTRHTQSEKSRWVYDIGTLIVDEAHLITDGNLESGDGRGHKLEGAIMRFTELNPSARVVFLSATMPNVQELGGWLQRLTNRQTDVVQSAYRPCQLNRNFISYYDGGNMRQRRQTQMEQCLEIIKQFPQDQFLVFVSSKKWGSEFLSFLMLRNLEAEFHNADKKRPELNVIEKRFRDRQLRILISTSTLAAGVNLPARRVLIPHVSFGRDQDLPAYQIHQQEGRAGRLGYDTGGDSYILIPESSGTYHQQRIAKGEKIISRLQSDVAIIFHLLGEIYYGKV